MANPVKKNNKVTINVLFLSCLYWNNKPKIPKINGKKYNSFLDFVFLNPKGILSISPRPKNLSIGLIPLIQFPF